MHGRHGNIPLTVSFCYFLSLQYNLNLGCMHGFRLTGSPLFNSNIFNELQVAAHTCLSLPLFLSIS